MVFWLQVAKEDFDFTGDFWSWYSIDFLAENLGIF
jgi:hypothetical protein